MNRSGCLFENVIFEQEDGKLENWKDGKTEKWKGGKLVLFERFFGLNAQF